MTNQEKIEVIRKACIKANDDILKLQFGCLISCNDFSKPSIREYAGWKWDRDTESKIRMVMESSGQLFPFDDNFEILGRPIRLADVLLAIEKKNLLIAIDEEGAFIQYDSIDGEYTLRVYENWNLLKDSIYDQSEETINFLYELLK